MTLAIAFASVQATGPATTILHDIGHTKLALDSEYIASAALEIAARDRCMGEESSERRNGDHEEDSGCDLCGSLAHSRNVAATSTLWADVTESSHEYTLPMGDAPVLHTGSIAGDPRGPPVFHS